MTRPDRRQHVRVRDMVRLRFEPVDERQIEQVWEEQTFERAREAARYPSPPKPAARYMAEETLTSSELRTVVEALHSLENKVDYTIALLDRMAESEMTDRFGEPIPCDISGAGIRFACDDAPAMNSRMKVVFVPGGHSGRPIHSIARVIRVDGHDPVWGPKAHRVAVEFDRIAEEDRERIISRTFDLQREMLRSRRTERTTEKSE